MCYWVQRGSEACGSVHRWVSRNCADFEEMEITRVAECVGARIGLPTDTCMGWTSSVWLRDSEVPRDQPHWRMAWRRFEWHTTVTASHCMLFPRHRKNLYCIALLSLARWKHIIVCVDWTDPTPTLFYLHTKCKGQRQPYVAQWNKHVASHDTLRSQRQRFLSRSADIVSRKSFPPSAMEVVPLAPD